MSESTNEKIKNCMFCKKALIDETVPICLRCRLKSKKNAIGVIGCLGAGALGLMALGNAQNKTDDSIDTDYHDDNEDT